MKWQDQPAKGFISHVCVNLFLKTEKSKQVPTVTIHDLSPSVMHLRTGFTDICELLCFATVVCSGNLSLLTRKTSFIGWENVFSNF